MESEGSRLSPDCPDCGAPLPVVRVPRSLRQALWGGWTCPACGAEVDRWGRKVGRAGRPQQSWTLDDELPSDNPAGLTLSDAKLRHLRPDLYEPTRRFAESVGLSYPQRLDVAEQLRDGDPHAAVVVSARPLYVAAYGLEFDRVVMLAFPDDLGLADAYNLRDGSRLLTANTYGRVAEPDRDLFLSPDFDGPLKGLRPLIADFVTDDDHRLAVLKAGIPESEWSRAARLGTLYRARFPHLARDGRPIYCQTPDGGPDEDVGS